MELCSIKIKLYKNEFTRNIEMEIRCKTLQ